MSKFTSIPDIPCPEKDSFGIHPYAQGLVRFIECTATPITIALQGEWGSGKTSLMNTLQDELCGPDGQYLSVWINTWEYALMSDSASTLIQIISKMVQQTAGENEAKRNALFEKVKKIGAVAAKTAIGISGGDASTIDELFTNKTSTVGELRDELQTVVKEKIEASQKRGFIFFIDDLDRINPPTAVELLELLKNIFTIDNCVFVLAIDYDVVVKGLKPKFGELTDTNEREFRSFFDKIIQVPFSMPVSNYRVDGFLQEALSDIGWCSATQRDNKELMRCISEAAKLTVGNNPRSLKRLLNNLSLIKCINEAQNTSDGEFLKDDLAVFLSFALVSLQIAYPKIYNVLNKYPGFTTWNEDVAFQLNLKPLDDTTRNSLATTAEFDEDWEQLLYRICHADPYLRNKALNISTLLNVMRTVIIEKNKQKNEQKIGTNEKPIDSVLDEPSVIEDNVRYAMIASAVTNLEAHDQAPVDYHHSSFLKGVRDPLIVSLRKALPEAASIIAPASARVQENAPIQLPGTTVNLSTCSDKGRIRLNLHLDICMNCPWNGLAQHLEQLGVTERFNEINQQYEATVQKFSVKRMACYESRSLQEGAFPYYSLYHLRLQFGVLFPDTEAFKEQRTIADMTEMVCAMLKARQQIMELLNKYGKLS